MSYGCAAAFGPGYTVQKQRVEVTYTQQAADKVSVRASYDVKNTGTKPLSVLELEPPYSEIIQPHDLHVEWRGKTIEFSAPVTENDENEIRIPLPEKWKIGESGNFSVSYDVNIAPQEFGIGSNHESAFFLPSSGWLPVLLPAHGAFATGGKPPAKWDLVVSVPDRYRVRASGQNRGKDKHGTPPGVIFQQRPGTNYAPYVAAGPYIEQQVHSSGGTVVFWTAQPLTSKRSAELGKLISADSDFFDSEFGAGDAKKSPIWLIECSPGNTALQDRPWVSVKGCLTQPNSAVVPPEYFGAAAPDEYMKSIDLQLAATWLYFSARPTRYGALFPVAAIPDYAAVTLGVSRFPKSRTPAIQELMRRVDAIPDGGKPLIRVDAKDSPDLKDRARAESVLFLFALEDRCGAQNVRKGIARASRLLRGDTWGLPDLRSAVEAECGGPGLESLFREWMHGPGIPAEFRARYSAAK